MSSPQVHRDTSVTMKLEIVVIPVSNVDTAEGFSATSRLEARRRLRGRRRLSRDPVHAAGFELLGHLRQERHRRDAGLGAGSVSDRLRHRGPPVQTCSAKRHQGERRLPRRRCHTPGRTKPYLFGRLRVQMAVIPQRASYRSFASFNDPDGNGWLFQEITARLPGRVDASATTLDLSADLAAALRRAAIAHGEHEKRTGGQHDENWPDW